MSLLKRFIFERIYFLRKFRNSTFNCRTRNFSPSRYRGDEYKTMYEIKNELAKMLETDIQYSPEKKSRLHLLKYLPKEQNKLPARKMRDSFCSAMVPLSTNVELRDLYTTYLGQVRLGRLVEDMDMFAVWCCTKHLLGPKATEEKGPFPYILVTIRVDDIEFMNTPIQVETNIRLSGYVCWVGKSSLEVIVWLDQPHNGKWVRISEALFLMGARNSVNTGPAIVNPLVAENEEESELLSGGNERKLRRLLRRKDSLLKKMPTDEELSIIHNLFTHTIEKKDDMFMDNMILPPNSKWMHSATLYNLVFCHPQHRNLHNKIFGGFLMRQALELSYTIAFLHGMRKPTLMHVTNITFYNAVEVGSLLKLYGSITYTESECVQIFVRAEAISQSYPKGTSTTGFHFTYRLGKPLDQIYPSTYLEAMKFIDGRRHFLQLEDYNSIEKKIILDFDDKK